jgi:hypothetical protein
MGRCGVMAVGIVVLTGCASAPAGTGHGYQIRQIGGTVLVERVAPAGARAIGGAMIGTAIAARLQSKPIPLKPGTDYACKYQDVLWELPASCLPKGGESGD